MRVELASLNHCTVLFLTRVAANFFGTIIRCRKTKCSLQKQLMKMKGRDTRSRLLGIGFFIVVSAVSTRYGIQDIRKTPAVHCNINTFWDKICIRIANLYCCTVVQVGGRSNHHLLISKRIFQNIISDFFQMYKFHLILRF